MGMPGSVVMRGTWRPPSSRRRIWRLRIRRRVPRFSPRGGRRPFRGAQGPWIGTAVSRKSCSGQPSPFEPLVRGDDRNATPGLAPDRAGDPALAVEDHCQGGLPRCWRCEVRSVREKRAEHLQGGEDVCLQRMRHGRIRRLVPAQEGPAAEGVDPMLVEAGRQSLWRATGMLGQLALAAGRDLHVPSTHSVAQTFGSPASQASARDDCQSRTRWHRAPGPGPCGAGSSPPDNGPAPRMQPRRAIGVRTAWSQSKPDARNVPTRSCKFARKALCILSLAWRYRS